jgi:hypothetical protein
MVELTGIEPVAASLRTRRPTILTPPLLSKLETFLIHLWSKKPGPVAWKKAEPPQVKNLRVKTGLGCRTLKLSLLLPR